MRSRSVVLATLGLLVLPAAAAAQRGTAWRDSTTRLAATMQALRDSLLQRDSTAHEVARRGDMVAAASDNERATAVEALDRLTGVRDRRFSGAMPSDAGFHIIVRTAGWTGTDRSGLWTQSKGTVVVAGLPDTGASVQAQRAGSSSTVARQMIDLYGEMMIASVPDLSRWIESPPPLSQDETERRDEAMYAFVTANGAIQQRCAAGGLAACQVALRLRRIDGPENGGRYSPFMRTDLLYFALDQGRAGAWQRLRTAVDTGVEARLAAAAGMPFDSLLSRWRSDLLARRPFAPVLPVRSAVIAIIWSALLLLGALGAPRWA